VDQPITRVLSGGDASVKALGLTHRAGTGSVKSIDVLTTDFRVFEEPGAATEVVAGGSVAGRIPDWAGQCAAGRRRLEEALEQRRGAEDGEEFKGIRRGWFFGDEALKQELLGQMGEKAGPWHCGEAVQEAAEAKAERIVKAELAKRKWNEQVLAGRRKGDPVKVVSP
jgi:hypothetical protein